MITLTIIGNNSAIPAHGRWPTSQIVAIRDQHFLVDCGEGTQTRLQQQGIGWSRIHHIFISHLHGDHYYGLIGLLTSMNLLGRTQELHLYAAPELEEILQLQINISGGKLNYPLHFHSIDNAGEHRVLLDDKYFKVTCFPVAHRIPCHGFIFTAKNSGRKLLPEKCAAYDIPSSFFGQIKEGADYIDATGKVIANALLTENPLPELTYAFCADTVYDEQIIPYIQDCHTIYHEATFLKIDTQKAIDRFHSTTEQAATIALKANVQRLLLGHYSSRYEQVTDFELEARIVFPNSFATHTGDVFEIKH